MQPLGKSGSHPIVFDPSLWAQLAPRTQPQAPVAPTPQHGRGGFLSSIISELSGAGGAAGGAALGTAIAPGIGTLAGAIIGGFAGGTGGRLAENKIRDNQYNVGSALKEGGLDAAFSGVSGAFNAYKGLKAASAVKNALPGVEDVVANVPQKVGALERAGYNLKAAGGGYGVGARLNGERIGTSQSMQIDNLLNKLKVPAGSPEARQAALENHISNMNNTLTNLYAKNVQRVQPTSLGQQILNDVNKLPLLDNAAKKSAQDFVTTQLKGVKNTNDLWRIIKQIDANKIKWGGSPSAKLVDREAVARIIRSNIRDVLNKKLPGVANTNSLYHDAVNANELLKGISSDSGSGLFSKVASLAPVKGLESKTGAIMEKVGKLSAGTGGSASKVINQAKVQAPPNLAEAISGITTPVSTSPDQSNSPYKGFDQTATQGPYYDPTDPFGQGSQLATAYGAMNQPTQAQSGSPYTQDNLMADIQRDPKHMNDYLSLYKTLDSIAQSNSKVADSNIGKVSSQNFSNAQSGYQALQSLAQLIQSDPTVLTRENAPGRGLPIVGGYIANKANTTTYDALAANVADKYIRLTTGATANEGEINNLKSKMLPRPGDSPQEAQLKLQQFASLFQSILQQAQGQGSGSDLTDVLSQLQTQGAY